MARKNNKMSRGKKIGVGAGIGVAVAAATIASVYLMSDRGKNSRRKIKGWTLKAKGEVIEGLEKLEEINEDAYKKIVDQVAKRYRTLKHVDKSELALMAAELRGQWKAIQGEWNRAKRRGKSSPTRTKKSSRSRRKRT